MDWQGYARLLEGPNSSFMILDELEATDTPLVVSRPEDLSAHPQARLEQLEATRRFLTVVFSNDFARDAHLLTVPRMYLRPTEDGYSGRRSMRRAYAPLALAYWALNPWSVPHELQRRLKQTIDRAASIRDAFEKGQLPPLERRSRGLIEARLRFEANRSVTDTWEGGTVDFPHLNSLISRTKATIALLDEALPQPDRTDTAGRVPRGISLRRGPAQDLGLELPSLPPTGPRS